jgi:hypothetical protein
MPEPLSNRLIQATENLRNLFKEYTLLPDDEKKAARAGLYKKTGSFGKAVIPMADRFQEIETELAAKGKPE